MALVNLLDNYNQLAVPNNALVSHETIQLDVMIRYNELELDLNNFTWLVEKVGSYALESDYRDNFLLPLVATLPANAYPAVAGNNSKKVDIRQLYWILLVLNMMSNMNGFKISCPPTHSPLSLWLYRTARRVSEVVLVIYKLLNKDCLGNNPVFPRNLPANVGNFAWYKNEFNPLILTKNISCEVLGQSVDAYDKLREIENAILGNAEVELRGTNQVFKKSILGPGFMGSVVYNQNALNQWNHQQQLGNNVAPYVQAQPHVIVTFLRRIADNINKMLSMRLANGWNNLPIPAWVPIIFRTLVPGQAPVINIAQQANNAVNQGNALIAAGLNQFQANIGINAGAAVNAAAALLPPILRPAGNPQLLKIMTQREEQLANHKQAQNENFNDMMTLVNANFNNNIIPQLMAPPPIAPYAAPLRNPSVLAALARNGNAGINTIEALLDLNVFVFTSDQQRQSAITNLDSNFITFDGLIEMYETNWTANDNFRSRLHNCNIPQGLAIILVNGLNLLVT